MIQAIRLWYIRWFVILTEQEAKQLRLHHYRNVYGDEINHINCRSIWIDNKGREYRISELYIF